MSVSVAAVLFAAAITPGPNNFVVMDAAARGRLAHAAAPIAGIVLGTLGMVLAVRFGLDVVLARQASVMTVLRYVGAALLLYLALRIVVGGWAETEPGDRTTDPPNPSSGVGLFASMLALQIVNPKTWVLATTVSTAHAVQGNGSLPVLVALTLSVPAACLALWAIGGRALAPIMERNVPRRVFAFAMGSVLAAFAFALVLAAA